MRHWKVTVKEVGHSQPVTSEIVGNYDRKQVIDFYGLREPDVEWYKIEELKTKKP